MRRLLILLFALAAIAWTGPAPRYEFIFVDSSPKSFVNGALVTVTTASDGTLQAVTQSPHGRVVLRLADQGVADVTLTNGPCVWTGAVQLGGSRMPSRRFHIATGCG